MKTYTLEDRKIIRDYYNNNKEYNVYFMDFYSYMTVIEHNIWHDIRKNGLRFYQQFPILNYFVDFADPINKIVIEADGREYHKDILKDKKRQSNIEELGWKVFRVNGCDTFVEMEIDYDLYDKDINGSIEDFKSNYFNKLSYGEKKYVELIKKLIYISK